MVKDWSPVKVLLNYYISLFIKPQSLKYLISFVPNLQGNRTFVQNNK